jgi:hypothetical protein
VLFRCATDEHLLHCKEASPPTRPEREPTPASMDSAKLGGKGQAKRKRSGSVSEGPPRSRLSKAGLHPILTTRGLGDARGVECNPPLSPLSPLLAAAAALRQGRSAASRQRREFLSFVPGRDLQQPLRLNTAPPQALLLASDPARERGALIAGYTQHQAPAAAAGPSWQLANGQAHALRVPLPAGVLLPPGSSHPAPGMLMPGALPYSMVAPGTVRSQSPGYVVPVLPAAAVPSPSFGVGVPRATPGQQFASQNTARWGQAHGQQFHPQHHQQQALLQQLLDQQQRQQGQALAQGAQVLQPAPLPIKRRR